MAAPKTPQTHALPMFLLIALAAQIILLAEGRHINSAKSPTFTSVPIHLQRGLIATPAQQGTGQTDSERLATVMEKPSCVEETKTKTAISLTPDVGHGGQFSKLQDHANNESNKLELQQHTPDLPSAYSAQDNGRRPPPRVSTVPGHSPGDGH